MVKKVRKFNYQRDRKKDMRKKKAKKNPKVNAEQLKPFWDPKKTILENYRDLGLAADPNKTLEIPKAKTFLIPETMEIAKVNRTCFFIISDEFIFLI
jgi:hypothetical protein